ncbi:hypothetical protein DFQ28_010681 [Apophysomyces sp. BC1034]|nr:hypothetical protein DFQ28_010681 [Apophysomyces sp. BC1034]
MPPPVRPEQSGVAGGGGGAGGGDNEYSTNTTHSVSSILITSQHRQSLPARPSAGNNSSALAQLNPDYPIQKDSNQREIPQIITDGGGDEQDTVHARPDPFKGKVAHPQQHKLLAQSDFWPPQQSNGLDTMLDPDVNQLTVGSMNQLTVNSVASMGVKYATTAQIDDYIRRLLEAGYATKVSKQLCLKSAEVNAICRTAMEIFLSQPVMVKRIESAFFFWEEFGTSFK